jgi:CRP-like cAMP-binding protein
VRIDTTGRPRLPRRTPGHGTDADAGDKGNSGDRGAGDTGDRADRGDPGMLRSLVLFAGLPDDELEELATHCSVTTAHPGQVVQAQDVPVRMWHVITGGHAVVQRDGRPIGLLGRDDSWSEHSLLNQLHSSIAVVALSPLTLLTVSRRTFFEIPDHHPVLAGRLVARSAFSADRLALPLFNALVHRADTGRTRRCPGDQYD